MDKVFVGKIVNTHGIKGEFKIKSDFEKKEDAFKRGNHLIINNNTYEINTYRVHKGLDMISLVEFDNINQILPFKGLNVFIDRNELNTDDYLLIDLIDMDIVCNGEILGKVVDYTNDGNPLLFIDGDNKFSIPIKGDFIKSVDKDKREVEVTEETKGLII